MNFNLDELKNIIQNKPAEESLMILCGIFSRENCFFQQPWSRGPGNHPLNFLK